MDSYRKMLARIALRYDTAMSCAMLRALGIKAPRRHAEERPSPVTIPEGDAYEGMLECMGQRYGVRL